MIITNFRKWHANTHFVFHGFKEVAILTFKQENSIWAEGFLIKINCTKKEKEDMNFSLPSIYDMLLLFSHSVMSNSFVIPWTIAHQDLLSMGFSRQEYWSGSSFPSPGNFLNPGMEPMSPALAAWFFTNESLQKPPNIWHI